MSDLAVSEKRASDAVRLAAKPSSATLIYSAEAIGTFMLVLVGTAVATAATLGKGTAGASYNSLAVALAFGVILTPIVGALGPVSGAHVNPAVTLGLAVAGKFPWRYVGGYMAAQTVGAILAAIAVWLAFGHGAYTDSHLGAPSPVNGATGLQVFLVEALIAFILVLTVLFTATDPRVPPGVASIAIGCALAAGVFLGGPVSGGAGNPARAIGPMLVTLQFPVWFFYVVGPLLGGTIAAIAFKMIGEANAPTVSLEGLEGAPVPAAAAAEPVVQAVTSRVTMAEQRIVEAAGALEHEAEQGLAEVKQMSERALNDARTFIHKKPLPASLSAFGVGAAFGALLRLGRR